MSILKSEQLEIIMRNSSGSKWIPTGQNLPLQVDQSCFGKNGNRSFSPPFSKTQQEMRDNQAWKFVWLKTEWNSAYCCRFVIPWIQHIAYQMLSLDFYMTFRSPSFKEIFSASGHYPLDDSEDGVLEVWDFFLLDTSQNFQVPLQHWEGPVLGV